MNNVAAGLPLSVIRDGTRLRTIDPDWAKAIATSMEEIGLSQPIEVTEPDQNGIHTLIAGAHRLHAARDLGWETIPAVVFTGDQITRQIREIDENLVRRELSLLDRGVFLARRKALYLQSHPETAHGGDRVGEQVRTVIFCSPRFSAEMAKKLNLSPATIDRGVRVADRIVPDVRDLIATTWLADSWADLRALTELTPEDQRRCVRRVLRDIKPAASIADALRDVRGEAAAPPDVDEEQLRALLGRWRKAGAVARRRFLANLIESDAIDLAELVPEITADARARLQGALTP